jgi:hypothetical protein
MISMGNLISPSSSSHKPGRGWWQPWCKNQLYSNFSMTSKKPGAERVAYEPAIMAKREAEMESGTIASTTMDPGE